MLIQLKDIKKNAHYVRKQTDREKLDELADSIQEIGMLMPVKVRTNGTGYEVVFGQRRVDAARQAGLEEIEAIVVMVSDEDALIQGLAENVIREDMAAIDIAKALAAIKEKTGWTNEKIGQQFGWSEDKVKGYLAMLEFEGEALHLDPDHVRQAKAGTGGDKKLVEQVLEAAAETELSTRETRSLAEKVKAANEFDGEKGVKATIQQFKKNHKELGKAWLKEHDQPIIGKVKGKLLFEWLKDPRVLQAEEGVRAISAAVAAIAQSNEDPAGGLHVLHSLQEKVDILLEQIGDVLEDME